MKIRLLEVDDWQGLYIDDKLIMENHSLELYSVIQILLPNADFKVAYLDELKTGLCPNKWSKALENKSG
jgi:hypothetical protein